MSEGGGCFSSRRHKKRRETEMMDPPAPATVVLSCSVGTHGVVS